VSGESSALGTEMPSASRVLLSPALNGLRVQADKAWVESQQREPPNLLDSALAFGRLMHEQMTTKAKNANATDRGGIIFLCWSGCHELLVLLFARWLCIRTEGRTPPVLDDEDLGANLSKQNQQQSLGKSTLGPVAKASTCLNGSRQWTGPDQAEKPK